MASGVALSSASLPEAAPQPEERKADEAETGAEAEAEKEAVKEAEAERRESVGSESDLCLRESLLGL